MTLTPNTTPNGRVELTHPHNVAFSGDGDGFDCRPATARQILEQLAALLGYHCRPAFWMTVGRAVEKRCEEWKATRTLSIGGEPLRRELASMGHELTTLLASLALSNRWQAPMLESRFVVTCQDPRLGRVEVWVEHHGVRHTLKDMIDAELAQEAERW